VTTEHAPTPAYRAADPPTAYTARIVAAGVAAAAGAMLTSMIDSRGTVVGAILVSMTVSALGQAMRRPLDRLQRQLRGQATRPSRPLDAPTVDAVQAPARSRRAARRGGVGRSILLIGLVGFLVGMGVFGAREIALGRALTAQIVRRLESLAASESPVQLAQTALAPDDEDQADKPATREPAKQAPATPARPAATPGPSGDQAKGAGTSNGGVLADKVKLPATNSGD
jgi:hypothetical protein